MEYNFNEIEQKWKKWWKDNSVYTITNDTSKPKCYVLDMFPYPSGAGLHVGHPLGYIASDIYARYKRQCGFQVLHPMGFDAFGLPAEQYALETGQHPSVTTEKNIKRYREQLDNIGFSFDWSRSVTTSDPEYYRWTQWIFVQLFEAWFDRTKQKARPVTELISIFEQEGNANCPAPSDERLRFDAQQWRQFSLEMQRDVLMKYRIAYLDYAEVWWCEALGTVLANDEVINGQSERGGHPCVRKKMRQWMLRITEFAERLLQGLETLDWTEGMKEMQRSWIGKSTGAEVQFALANSEEIIEVFTTRPDTLFGVDFMVLAPEHELVPKLTTKEQEAAVAEYQAYVERRSERERMAEVKQVTGAFTGAYALHPFSKKPIPIYISEYVLAGYGTGAIMAVPAGDERDHAFARHFQIPITNIFGSNYEGSAAYTDKSGLLSASDFLNGMEVGPAMDAAIEALEAAGIGRRRVNYKLRDAGFSRQRYWGEPFPIVYQNDQPFALGEPALNLPEELSSLPVTLPHVESYRPGPEGQGPLANIEDWVETPAGRRETNTMPGYAGSSWYFLRYMDPHNQAQFVDKAASDYWQQVDVYVGGTEHAVGHLLYARMWTKALADLGFLSFDEPFKKLVNQGMIQGSSRYIAWNREANTFISQSLLGKAQQAAGSGLEVPSGVITELRVDVNLVDGVELNIEAFKAWRPEYQTAQFLLDEQGKFTCTSVVEKMSKSKYNVVNPDDIVAQYGADTFRMYEMFLGPIEVSKPWDTQGIEGVHRFLKKLWRLYVADGDTWLPEDEPATEQMLRSLHKTIKKTAEDIERFGFNTCVSQFMICINELSAAQCKSREVLEPLVVILAPFAPHFAEELWHRFGHYTSVLDAAFPRWEEQYLVENSKLYPVAINGKTRTEIAFALDAAPSAIEAAVLQDEVVLKWLEGKTPKKVIYVKGRMINLVV
ncbi:MAG: leucine--tRNA ligase [Bacteroidetes bacterium]|nr:leucine--tRNA ligase [Bacteroidota bacterium]